MPKYDRKPLMKHVAGGVQFAVFILVGALVGSYLDPRESGAGIVSLLGIFLGAIAGSWFLIKDMLYPPKRRDEDDRRNVDDG